jgi:hypothetical protein
MRLWISATGVDKLTRERRETSSLKPQFMLRSLMHRSKIYKPRFETADASDD